MSIWGIGIILLALFVLMMFVVTIFGVTLLVRTRKDRPSGGPAATAQAHR